MAKSYFRKTFINSYTFFVIVGSYSEFIDEQEIIGTYKGTVGYVLCIKRG